MPVKRIQPRGISHNPSDRMTTDGGCSDSVNVYIDDGELAPMLSPKVIDTDSYDSMEYIHQGNYLLVQKDTRNGLYMMSGGIRVTVHDFTGEKIQEFNSVGNTLLVRTDKTLHYLLWKDGAYKYLGDRIPEPVVTFTETTEETDYDIPWGDGCSDGQRPGGGDEVKLFSRMKFVIGYYPDYAMTPDEYESKINYLLKYRYTDWKIKDIGSGGGFSVPDWMENEAPSTVLDTLTDFMWGQTQNAVVALRQQEIFCFPVFVRYAVKLYDGSYSFMSCPQLLGVSKNNLTWKWYASEIYNTDGTDTKYRDMVAELPRTYKVRYNISYEGIEDWKDIIRSVGIFMSTDVSRPSMGSKVCKMERDGDKFMFLMEGMENLQNKDEYEQELLSKSIFYEVEEKDINDIDNTNLVLKPLSQDDLVVKSQLSSDECSAHFISPMGNMMQYNQRIIFSGVRKTLSTGFREMPCKSPDESTEYSSYRLRYYLHGSDGQTKIVTGRNLSGGLDFPDEPFGFLYYPDPNCYKIEFVYVGDRLYRYEIPMEEHPRLNGAYAIADFTTGYFKYLVNKEQISSQIITDKSDVIVEEPDKVYMSEVSDPFIFPTANRLTFTDDVITAATTTMALSEGQFGQYPLYVFTKGGIWAVSLNSDGTFLTNTPLSREVAISADAVTPIDQAIVFVTERAVNVLRGSDVKMISPYMERQRNGFASLDSDWAMRNAVSEKYGSKMVTAVCDTMPFMKFMGESRCVYDYRGARLIFMHDGKPYQYVYCLVSQTWHRMVFSHDKEFTNQSSYEYRTVNSYPEAYVSYRFVWEPDPGAQVDTCALMDFSTYPDEPAEDLTTLPSVIVTRAFDLDEPDVLKSISHLRFRGVFKAYETDASGNRTPRVSFFLLGSQNGIDFTRLRSLRGKSWKSFRIVLLSSLDPDERISWIDIDYGTRFTNRLR